MSKEVTKKESAEVATMDFGMDDPILAEEIIIPKLLVMQPGSSAVTKGEASFGQMLDSMTGEKLGDLKNPVEFIPFFFERVFYVSRKEGSRWKFDRIVPFTAANKDTPYETTINGQNFKNEKAWQYYVMLPGDMSIPRIITFKGMSRRAGEILYTDAYVKSKMLKKRHVDFVYELKGFPKENEKGTFAMITATKKRETTPEELREVYPWFKSIKEGMAKAHTESEEQESQASTVETQARVKDIPDQF